ncbi:MAG: type II secretion system protein [Phycisphaerae bacterium]|nr:type II secretion system protein [Phycisphaerae bacterium]
MTPLSRSACAGVANGRYFRREATTLIETLVVIAIIGILITMLLPSLHRTMKMASDTVCKHNLRSIYQSLQVYRLENDGWLPADVKTPPPSPLSNARSSGDVEQSPNVWFLKLFPNYMQDPVALTCPEDPYRLRIIQSPNFMRDPNVADYPSYGINSFMMTAAGGQLADLDRNHPSHPLDTIMVADMGPDTFAGQAPPKPDGKPFSGGPSRNAGQLSWDDGFDMFAQRMQEPWLTTRHWRGINILTLGGGVRSVRTDEVMQRELRFRYEDCLAGGCTLCGLPVQNRLFHYSFAKDRLFWWTGPLRVERLKR